MQKSDDSGSHCLASDACCDDISEVNRNCYRAQLLRDDTVCSLRALELDTDRHSVSFQSRLGRDPWIQPFTDEVLPKLAERRGKEPRGGLPIVRRRLSRDARGDRAFALRSSSRRRAERP